MSGKKSVLVIGTIMLIGVLLYPLLPLAPSVPRVVATTTISLVGTIAGWNSTTTTGINPTITVTQGDSVTLQLTSTDTTHQFYVDVDKNGIADCPNPPTSSPDKCSLFFTPISPTAFMFTIDFSTGTYTYFCSLHPSTMFGKFTVKTSQAVGGSIVPVNKPVLATPYIAATVTILAALAVTILYVRRKTGARSQ
jgi:plastocyanin